jgi:hypothetical protein
MEHEFVQLAEHAGPAEDLYPEFVLDPTSM